MTDDITITGGDLSISTTEQQATTDALLGRVRDRIIGNAGTSEIVEGMFLKAAIDVASNLPDDGIIRSVPSGAKMLFQQSTAPMGWTKDTAHNDKALRVVSGSAGSGGTNGFKSRFGQDQIDLTSTISGQTAGHAITEAQMARHTHSIPTADAGGTSSTSRVGEAREASWGSSGRAYMTHTGGNQPHSHGAGSLEVASSIALDVAYVDVIIATKD